MPLPLHQSLLFPLIFAKEHLSLALFAPPVAPSLSIPTTFSKAHQPLRPALNLPPLSKGGGLTARHKLLLCCFLLVIRLPFQFIKLFCRQDGGIVTPPTLPKPHYPSLCIITLASLVKGEVLSPEKIRATTGGIVTPPTFFKTALSLAPHHVLASLVKGEVLSPEKIRATTGGIAPYPHQPSKNRTVPRKLPSPSPP